MDEETSPGSPSDEAQDTLRAKYYDYCSARVADVLLGMAPDQIFVAAEEEARARGLAGELGYERMMKLATEQISRQIGLPTFDQWLEAYERDPDAIEGRLMGLWKSDAEDTKPTPS